jgi:glutathione synthase/RimK-type ligase-like ATP-grasp enzyme
MSQQLDADVALLTERRYVSSTAPDGDWYLSNILRDDQLLQEALAQYGLSSTRVDWSRPDVDWSRYRCAVFRTTWDYFDRFDQFKAWLNRVETQTMLCNPATIVRWNMDKHYLADLEARGISVVPSRFVEQGSTTTVADLLDETGWSDAVIKPCVSGAARHTYRVCPANAQMVEPIVQQLLAVESMILQPFQEGIVQQGEDTLMVFGGRYSHAVRKVAKSGDFRVQDDYGGTVHEYHPTSEQVELAERAVSVCQLLPAYGRVDMVCDNQGRLAIMELELIEPELWLRCHPPAATAMAAAIAGYLRRNAKQPMRPNALRTQ